MALYQDSYGKLARFAQLEPWQPPLSLGEFILVDPQDPSQIEAGGVAIYQDQRGQVIEFISAGSGGWEATLWPKDPGGDNGQMDNEGYALGNDASLDGLINTVIAALELGPHDLPSDDIDNGMGGGAPLE